MYRNESEILHNALNFLYYYTQNEAVRERTKKTGFYDKKPLFFYIQTLIIYSPAYRKYYQQLTQTSWTNNLKNRIKQLLKREPDVIDVFLNKCWANKTVFNNLREGRHLLRQFSPEEIQKINHYSQLPDNQQKVDFLKQFFSQKFAVFPDRYPEIVKEDTKKWLVARAKGLVSSIGVWFKTHPLISASLGSGAVGGGLAGVSLGPQAVPAGFGAGAIVPALVTKLGIGKIVLQGTEMLAYPEWEPTGHEIQLVNQSGDLAVPGRGWLGRDAWPTRQLGQIVIKRGFLATPWGWAVIAGVIILILIILIPMGLLNTASLLPPFRSEPASGPLTGGPILDYSIPFRDKSIEVINPEAAKADIKTRWPNARLENWNTIIEQSKQTGWNSAFVLALWVEESGAQGAPDYDDALGCAPRQPTTDINLSLKCLFDNFGLYNNNRFADFMCKYSGETSAAPCQFLNNPDFPKNIKKEYAKLVPSGPGTIITPTPPSAGELRSAIENQFGIKFANNIGDQVLTWAWEVLSAAKQNAPNFFQLLHSQYPKINVQTTTGISTTSGDTIVFNTSGGLLSSKQLFKQVLIHELGHIIYGPRYAPKTDFKNGIINAEGGGEGYLTSYAENSTPRMDVVCDISSGDPATRTSEDFVETVAYYVNYTTPELSYSSTSCPPVKNTNINPLASGKYPKHLQFIKGLLGGTIF